MALCLLNRLCDSKYLASWWRKLRLCCIPGHRTWCSCSNDGAILLTLEYGVTIAGCITSIHIGSTLGSDWAVGVVDSSVVDSGTSTLGSCTGGLGASDGAVQRCTDHATFSKKLSVVSPAAKLGVVDDGGLVMSRTILMDDI